MGDAYRETADLAAAGKVEAGEKVRVEKQVPPGDQIEKASADLRMIQREVGDARQ